MAMAWCGYSRKGRQYRASSGGGAAGWSVSTSIPYILWLRCSNKALRPFSRGVYGWVFCAKNWQLTLTIRLGCTNASRVVDTTGWALTAVAPQMSVTTRPQITVRRKVFTGAIRLSPSRVFQIDLVDTVHGETIDP